MVLLTLLTLAANNTYRRHVTTLMDSTAMGALVVPEYFGQHSVGLPHSRNKQLNNKAPYTRTPATNMALAGELIQKGTVQGAYSKMVQELDVDAAPRDSAVVHNEKTRNAQLRREEGELRHCGNFAVEVQDVIRMVQTDDFVRSIEVTQSRVPSVVLYADR